MRLVKPGWFTWFLGGLRSGHKKEGPEPSKIQSPKICSQFRSGSKLFFPYKATTIIFQFANPDLPLRIAFVESELSALDFVEVIVFPHSGAFGEAGLVYLVFGWFEIRP